MYIDVLVASLSLSIYPFLYLDITLPTTISLSTKKNKNHKKIKKDACSALFYFCMIFAIIITLLLTQNKFIR